MFQLIDNAQSSQYEFRIEGHIAKIEYKKVNDKIYLIHTEVPNVLEGRGIGSQLIKSVLTDIQEQKLSLIALCPFVAAYLKRHPEWNTLIFKHKKI